MELGSSVTIGHASCEPSRAVKRRNVQEAFVGEPTGDPTQSLDNYADGEEAVDIEVRGGKVQLRRARGHARR